MLSRMDMGIIYAGNEGLHHWALPYRWFHMRPLASPKISPSLSSPITDVRWVIRVVFVRVFAFFKQKIAECLVCY